MRRRFGQLHSAFHGLRVAGDDDLIGRIQIGGADNLAFGGFLQNAVEFAGGQFEQRCHSADTLRNRFLHELAAGSNETERVGKIEAAIGDESGILAQAVTRNDGGLVAEFGQNTVSGYGSGENGGLRIRGFLEFVVRTVKAEFRESEVQSGVGFSERLACDREVRRELLAHTGELRPLAGKKESEI